MFLFAITQDVQSFDFGAIVSKPDFPLLVETIQRHKNIVSTRTEELARLAESHQKEISNLIVEATLTTAEIVKKRLTPA